LQDDPQLLDPYPLFNERIGPAGPAAPCSFGLRRDDHDLRRRRTLTNPLDEARANRGHKALVKDHRIGSLRRDQADGIPARRSQRHHLAPCLFEEEAHQLSVERLRGGDQDPKGPNGRLLSRSPVQTWHRLSTSILDDLSP
jgi:hypothetical protein